MDSLLNVSFCSYLKQYKVKCKRKSHRWFDPRLWTPKGQHRPAWEGSQRAGGRAGLWVGVLARDPVVADTPAFLRRRGREGKWIFVILSFSVKVNLMLFDTFELRMMEFLQVWLDVTSSADSELPSVSFDLASVEIIQWGVLLSYYFNIVISRYSRLKRR